MQAFAKDDLRCVRPLGGGPCPHGFEVTDAKQELEFLHFDQEQPVHKTYAQWVAQLPPNAAAWDDGINGGALCHTLFGVDDDVVHGVCGLRFRCGPRIDGSGNRMPFVQHSYCHML